MSLGQKHFSNRHFANLRFNNIAMTVPLVNKTTCYTVTIDKMSLGQMSFHQKACNLKIAQLYQQFKLIYLISDVVS